MLVCVTASFSLNSSSRFDENIVRELLKPNRFIYKTNTGFYQRDTGSQMLKVRHYVGRFPLWFFLCYLLDAYLHRKERATGVGAAS